MIESVGWLETVLVEKMAIWLGELLGTGKEFLLGDVMEVVLLW